MNRNNEKGNDINHLGTLSPPVKKEAEPGS